MSTRIFGGGRSHSLLSSFNKDGAMDFSGLVSPNRRGCGGRDEWQDLDEVPTGFSGHDLLVMIVMLLMLTRHGDNGIAGGEIWSSLRSC
jgi:hypothetical protein